MTNELTTNMNATSFIMLFQWLRWHRLRNGFRVLQERSALAGRSIFFCSLVVWGSLFALCYAGFLEMERNKDIDLANAALFMGCHLRRHVRLADGC